MFWFKDWVLANIITLYIILEEGVLVVQIAIIQLSSFAIRLIVLLSLPLIARQRVENLLLTKNRSYSDQPITLRQPGYILVYRNPFAQYNRSTQKIYLTRSYINNLGTSLYAEYIKGKELDKQQPRLLEKQEEA